MDVELLRQLGQCSIALDGGKRHLALKPGVWFRRGRLLIVSPDSMGTACPLSGRNSTYRLVQILEAGSDEEDFEDEDEDDRHDEPAVIREPDDSGARPTRHTLAARIC